MNDGLYPGTSDAVYFGSPEWRERMTPNVLEWGVNQTMSHVYAAFTGQIEFDTPSMAFGRAWHAGLLEPERFVKAFAVAGQCEAETGKKAQCSKNGKVRQCGKWYCSLHAEPSDVHDDVEAITATQMDTISAMRARLLRHPIVKTLRQNGGAEYSIAWTDKATGTACASRLDKYIDNVTGWDEPLILDLKSVEDASPKAISKAIESYGWARAAAMRQAGMEALTGKKPRYFLIAQEKSFPYEILIPEIGEETMAGAAWEVRNLLATWAKCVREGRYPGYGDEITTVDAPLWKLKEYQSYAMVNS